MTTLDYIVTGTGRNGTGYMSRVLTTAGLDCSHEGIFKPDGYANVATRIDGSGIRADSSWLATPFLGSGALADAFVVHLVRHPRDTIESLVRIGLFDDKPPTIKNDYATFIKQHCPSAFKYDTAVERATEFFITWTKMIDSHLLNHRGGSLVARVEDDPKHLLDALGLDYAGKPIYAYPSYNAGVSPLFEMDVDALPARLKNSLAEFCERHDYDLNKPRPAPRVFWSALLERSVHNYAVSSLLDVAMDAGMNGFSRIGVMYSRTDAARNLLCHSFMQLSRSKNDVIVMLDSDHQHPADIVKRLSSHPHGVTGALAFRRSAPFEPMFFVRGEDGRLRKPAEFERIVYECDAVGTGAIAIKRWVLDELMRQGHNYFFRYQYTDDDWRSSEDMHFAKICEDAGIKHHADCSTETPHLRTDQVTSKTWAKYREDHPEIISQEVQS